MDTVVISPFLIWGAGIAAALWLTYSFIVIPKSRRRLYEANPDSASLLAGSLAFNEVLRTIFACTAVAASVAIAIGLGIEWRLEQFEGAAADLEEVTRVRGSLESLVDRTQDISVFAWFGSLGALAILWLFISRGRSRSRWNKAIDARKKAIEAEVAPLTEDALRDRAERNSDDVLNRLDSDIEEVESQNQQMFEAFLQVPVLELADEAKTQLSLADLHTLVTTFREKAAESADVEETESLLATADGFSARISELTSELEVPIRRLDGSTDVSSLDIAQARLEVQQADIEARLRQLIVDYEIKNHADLSKGANRREPEILSEWISTAATSETAVTTTSKVGVFSGRVALIALLLGLISFGATSVAPALASSAVQIELSLSANKSQQDLAKSLAAMPNQPAEESEADLASDAETVEYMRQMFRVSTARAVRSSLNDAVLSTRPARRQLFDIAAVEARQRILQSSARQAGSSAGASAASHAYEVHTPTTAINERQATQILDEAFDRRVVQLRANETAWTRMRAAAARPASANFTANAVLRTALSTNELPESTAYRRWADNAATQYMEDAVRTGDPAKARVASAFDGQPEIFSARDQRILKDYRAEAPSRIASRAQVYQSGAVDVGSIHRTTYRGGMAAANSPSMYADLFPVAANSGGGAGSPRASTGGGGSSRISPRSYNRVRFSGRVGGVVIGRDPSDSGVELDIVGMDWSALSPTQFSLSVSDRSGRKISLGAYHPAIIHHAMAYAADGRVVTSTLPQYTGGDGNDIEVQARRVVVHPAFEDTSFACPAIQVDRFVDGFLYSDAAPNPLGQAVLSQRAAVTELGFLLGRLPNVPAYQRGEILEDLEPVAIHARTCGTGGQCFPIEPYEALGFRFDIKPTLACLSQNPNRLNCSEPLSNSRPGAAYLVDSGVRELPYTLDSDFDFITGQNAAAGNALWPLDFIIQAVPQTLDGGDVDVQDDWEPWNFPNVRDNILKVVKSGVAASDYATRILVEMRQFVVLQRLFRLALDGSLGLEFPLEAMADLQDATASSVRVVRNEKWNINNDVVRIFFAASEYFVNALKETRDNVSGACRQGLDSALNAEEARPWPQSTDVFELVLGIEGVCGNAAATRSIINTRDRLERQYLVSEAVHWAKRAANEAAQVSFYCPEL